MRMGVRPRLGVLHALCLTAAVGVAPVACAGGGPQHAGLSAPGPAKPTTYRTREQILNRDRALIGGLAATLALGIVGLGSLLANGNFAGPRDTAAPHGMPPAIAIAGGLMSAGFLAAIPLGVAVDRHRSRYVDVFHPERAPRPGASLRPTAMLRPAPRSP